MSHPRVFISFDFDNNSGQKLYFAGQAKNSRTPFNIQDWSSKESLPQKDWEARIEEKIIKCDLLIVLVGRRTFGATGVIKEIEFAKKNNIPFFGVYVDGANSTTNLPDGLARARVVAWEWDVIADMVDKCMKEGKNK